MTEVAALEWASPLLTRHGAVAASGIDSGVAWHYGDPVAEQRALERGAGVVDLSFLGVVRVSGPDRLTWLHSITSQQLEGLAPYTSVETLVLSPHGHIEHALSLVDDGTATWLISEPGTTPALTAWLQRMKFMLKVEVEDVTAQWAVLGEAVRGESKLGEPLAWSDPWPYTATGGTRYGLADDDHPGAERAWRLVVVPRETLSDAVAEREAAGWILAGTWAADSLRIAALRPRAGAEIDHKSIPHELDWLRTSVHLAKGCYRGQETVARVHNLGRPPRRLVFLHLDGSEHILPEPGAEVLAGERVAGTVTSVTRHHELGPVALAVIRRSTPLDEQLSVRFGDLLVAATQEVIVPDDGISSDRPAPRGSLTRGLGSQNAVGGYASGGVH